MHRLNAERWRGGREGEKRWERRGGEEGKEGRRGWREEEERRAIAGG